MIFSQDRITFLAREIVNQTKHLMDYRDEAVAYHEIKRVIENYLKIYDEIYDIVTKKLSSYSKPLREGTNDYNMLFKKFFDEELNKRGIYG